MTAVGPVLRSFPSPLPDESLFSLFCRYHIMSGNASPNDTHRQLTGSPVPRCHPTSSFRATALGDTVGARLGMSLQDLVNAFTVGPFYEWMTGTRIDPVELASSRRAFYRILPRAVRRGHVNEYDQAQHPSYCVACIADDTATSGISYWHRSHEPFEATVCHIHGCRLFTGARAADLCLPDECYRSRQGLISVHPDCALTVEPAWIEKAVAEIAHHVLNARRELSFPEAFEHGARRVRTRFGLSDEWVTPEFSAFIKAQRREVGLREWRLRATLKNPVEIGHDRT